MTIATKLRLCAALLLAAVGTVRREPRAALRKLRKSMALWIGGLKDGGLVDRETERCRVRLCEGCPLFERRLRTCGSFWKRSLMGVGCGCQMDAKARLRDAICWLDEEEIKSEFSWRANRCP